LSSNIPTEDAVPVTKLLQAGAIMLGKTNLPELAGDLQAIGTVFGPTNNPWNLEYVPGGSTSGAAAVAALLSPLELGSSIGGSIEVPSAWCGVFGYKPSQSRCSISGHIPTTPDQSRFPFEMASPGFAVRSIADLQLIQEIFMSERDTLDPTVVPFPLNVKFAQEKSQNDQIRIKYTTMPHLPLDKHIHATLVRTVEKLKSNGFQVEEQDLPYHDLEPTARENKFNDLYRTFGEYFSTQINMAGMSFFIRMLISLSNWWSYSPYMQGFRSGLMANLPSLGKVLKERIDHMEVMENYLKDCDVLMCPVSFIPAFKHCKTGTAQKITDKENVVHNVDYYLSGIGITCLMNLAGLPTLVIPVDLTPESLPVGIMLVARRWTDFELVHVGDMISKSLNISCQVPPNYN
jgi:amidase